MTRIDIINTFIKKYNYTSYLEIGCQNDKSFDPISIERKVGVDPENGGTLKMTSDNFFMNNKEKFDIIFIDGLHEEQQVYRDILNSLNFLNENGVIICHDMLPKKEEQQIVPRVSKQWTGDCWKAFVKISKNQKDLNLKMYTIDTDWGCSVIRKGKCDKNLLFNEELNWKNFIKNKKEWMNIITIQEFECLINQID